ncbi:polysaccharide deacetylase family protein [Roseimicrobium sp. ORNL1]|uniref:polysaccharide deacetylase family protein n=1 Tax=Roseimicrobium sp. ORNL1 TaxID=2711231 RepID=UPI0013E13F09|nr:polysaccharide deacetylase family protein [Roseimicrobium sp. ORNL1]QIF01534.1 polysaccharide deacetylase family protein [Roseimicrobium sp. ORNL1]
MRLLLASALSLLLACTAAFGQSPGDTRIAKWKDDRTAVFLLMFDDSWPSHWQVAAPELVKRGLTATFYICPAKGEYKVHADKWEKELWKQGMVYGVHTMTHGGIKDAQHGEYEIGENASYIRTIVPQTKDKLVSYARPGTKPGTWNITNEEEATLLKKHQLIDRPPFTGHGAVYHLKTTEEMLALADKAIAAKDMEYLVVHGVERVGPVVKYQDFWPLAQTVFFPLLDGLKERSEKGALWVTDHITYHQYLTEHDSAEVKVLESNDKSIRLQLSTKADPKLYDQTLTLVTTVPSSWKKCSVTQGTQKVTVPVSNGTARYDALPSGPEIMLQEDTTP